MLSTRSRITTLVAMFGLSSSACSTLDIEDYCRYSTDRSFRGADPDSLALVLGLKPGRATGSPFVVFRSVSEDELQASITLSATAAPEAMPISLDESRCAGVDWNTYTLTVDREQWNAFWLDGRTSNFEVAIAFLDHSEPLLVSNFGAAILETSAADPLLSCGCYWK